MKVLAVVALLFVVAQAHHNGYHSEMEIDPSKVIAMDRTIDVLENALKSQNERIYGGVAATRGQFPYQVAIFLNGVSFCGGSLISQRWVLTAAHCASGITTFTVYLGANNLDAYEDGRVIITTTSKIVHSGYNSNLNNNVALVNLGEGLEEEEFPSRYINAIKFATGSATYANYTARVSGWGKTSDNGGISNILKYADMLVITNAVCLATYGPNLPTLVASALCAKPTGGSPCQGDDGGPLVSTSTGLQIGVVNYISSNGCTSGYPVIFTRVTSFASWITANTGIAGA